jgi:hypothetical protein
MWLAAGMTESEILDEYPELEKDDFRAVNEFAAPTGQARSVLKLLFDQNLSRKLVSRLADLCPGSTYVLALGLLQSADSDVWSFTQLNGFIVVTTDVDFSAFATKLGPPT